MALTLCSIPSAQARGTSPQGSARAPQLGFSRLGSSLSALERFLERFLAFSCLSLEGNLIPVSFKSP